MKIIQISAAMNQDESIVFGLGVDGLLYYWDSREIAWVLDSSGK